jgi:pimeloyl-ACP methyl ester carboxylesterase
MTRETLVLIPGTLCDHTLFAHQVTALSDLVDCQVADSSQEEELSAMAGKILAGVTGNFALLGLSYGGIIAFEILRQAPHRVTKLILMHTNYKQPSQTTRMNQERWAGMACLGRFEEITTGILTDLMLHPLHAEKAHMRAALLNMARAVGKEGFLRQVKAQLGRPDSTADLAKITCPTLLITGREDSICPVALHQEMAEMIPRAQLEVIEQCGHLSTLEQPGKVNQCIRNWWLAQSVIVAHETK